MTTRLLGQLPRLLIVSFIAVVYVSAAPSQSDELPNAEKVTADAMLGKEAGAIRDDNGLKMKLVWCPPGFFNMETVVTRTLRINQGKVGALEASRPVRVVLTRGYWLGKYEVTQAEWKELLQTEPWKDKVDTKPGDDFPATWVDWNHAMTFCRRLTDRERRAGRLARGWEYTLPTEAQWERACRARTESQFSFGDDEAKLGEHMWFFDNAWNGGDKYAHGVGQKKPNPWGLYDMHGNVCEWCRDHYLDDLAGGRDPEVTAGKNRVFRGGGWNFESRDCRSAKRSMGVPTYQCEYLGFRVALTPVRPVK